MTKEDFTRYLLRTTIDSIAKYYLRPELTKPQRKNFSESIKRRVLRRQANLCYICRKPLGDIKEFDHINGNPNDNSYFNCQALCRDCHFIETRRRLKFRRKFGSRVA